MPVDPYQPCPCGSGKKIKFCCSADITGELEVIQRMLDGKQRLACLEHIDRLLEKHPDRAALLAVKGTLEVELGEEEKARKTIDTFLKNEPENPVALAENSLLLASNNGAVSGIAPLQKAIEACSESMPLRVYEAIGELGQRLLTEGALLSAIAHLRLHAVISGEENSESASVLMRLYASKQIPLLLKQDVVFAECPDGVPWKDEFEKAIDMAARGAWQAASDSFTKLADNAPGEPSIFKNLSLVRGFLGDIPAVITALRTYASLISSQNLEDAVEAEALAQMLSPEPSDDKITVTELTYSVEDVDKLLETLVSDRRISAMPIDPSQLVKDGNPPPKAVFWLLDRPAPVSGENITRQEVPIVLGEVQIFGRQTDRQARLEIVLTQTENWKTKKQILEEIAGELINSDPKEKTVGESTIVQETLSWSWRFPDDTPLNRRNDLVKEQRQDVLLNQWPQIPLSVLRGQTPEQAAEESSLQVPLLAAIFLLELAGDLNYWKFDFNQLREKLGLPTSEIIDSKGIILRGFPQTRLTRLKAETLTDEQLLDAYRSAAMVAIPRAIRNFATEIVGRSSLDGKIKKADIYGMLAGVAEDSKEAMSYIEQAKQTAISQNSSPAQWLIAELSLRLETNDTSKCNSLINEIRSHHMQEPGVAQGLFEVLVRFGIINPDGTPAGPPPEAAATSTEAGKLWTPGEPQPAAASPAEKPQEKSKLWVPGMD